MISLSLFKESPGRKEISFLFFSINLRLILIKLIRLFPSRRATGVRREESTSTRGNTPMVFHGVAASALFAVVDSVAFALSRRGMETACGIAGVAIFADNPQRFSRVAARSSALVIAGRLAYTLFAMIRARSGGASRPGDVPLTSIWDWQPPDTEAAGTWLVLKELVSSFNEISESYPEIKTSLETTDDLPQRLWYYLSTGVDEDRARIDSSALSEDDERGLALLRQYREYCVYSYECTSDQHLEARLATGGFTLIGAKYISDELSPAFFLAQRYDQGRRETMLCLRGTYSGSDVVTDLIAAGAPFGEGFAHSGMAKSAEYLSRRFRHLVGPDGAPADGVLTICGHSLGAGVAALLTHLLFCRSEGFCLKDSVRCLCYEPPACMSGSLAASMEDGCVYSLVNRDDLVPRLGPTPILNLLHELRQFDWRAAAEQDSNGMVRKITMLLAGNGGQGGDRHLCNVEANEDWGYDPVVPGRIFFIAPGMGPTRVDRYGDVLRRIQLTRRMVADHFVDSDEFASALAAGS